MRTGWSRSATNQRRYAVQDQIETKLEVVLKVRLRINRRRLKGAGIYCRCEHRKSSLVDQLRQQPTVRQRQPEGRVSSSKLLAIAA
jgi:hypothetical protein